MSKTESFEFLNELALAFRSGEKHARPQHTPVLEGVRAVLAHLQSAGSLLADDETRLTAEQVEDVEALVATANPYSAPAARLRALFPATEPAEEAPNLAAVAQEPRRFDPADECQNDNHDPGCGCGAQHWMTAPAPAEPAEEETKAEGLCEVRSPQGDTCSFPKSGHAGVHTWAWPDKKPASSPVVPAPTETGPWQRIEDVPEGVTVKSANGERFRKTGVGAIHLLTNGVGDCCQVDTEANPVPAPFFAVKEES